MATTLRRTRAKPASEHLHIILPGDLLERTDDHVTRLLAATPGARVTRADVVRMALHAFLAPFSAPAADPSTTKRKG
jgi:hypothetical protein